MNIALWVVFGMLSGVIANWLDPKRTMKDLVGEIVLGAMGALLGGMLANVLMQVTITGFNFIAFLAAIIGSLALLFVNNALQKS
jgi:uncharacterized membrane protein YeaQ/YmgE (transglycosylase-associated protein family)